MSDKPAGNSAIFHLAMYDEKAPRMSDLSFDERLAYAKRICPEAFPLEPSERAYRAACAVCNPEGADWRTVVLNQLRAAYAIDFVGDYAEGIQP